VRKIRNNSTDQIESPSDILQDKNAFGFGPNTNQVKPCQWCIAAGLSLGHKRCVVCSVDLSLDCSFLSELANSYFDKSVYFEKKRPTMATVKEVQDAIDRAVAGVKHHYDAKISVLENQITTLTAAGAAPTLTAKDIVDAIGSPRISNLTNNIWVPKFDAMKTTPMEFINEVERYFKLQNYQAGDYKDLFKGILPK
jgi:hypothetical protein